MKHKGSISQVNIARNRMAVNLYREAKRKASWPTCTMRLCEVAAELPVSEFYLPEETALKYVRRRIHNGVVMTFTNPYRMKLYEALYERVQELRRLPRHCQSSIPVIVEEAMRTEAPCIGLTPRSIYLLIPHRRYNLKSSCL